MSVYLVGAVDIHDHATYARYREGAVKALQAFGGAELLSADDHPYIIEGAQPANHLLLLKFESIEAYRAFHNSDHYQQVIGHRHNASRTPFLMVMRDRATVAADTAEAAAEPIDA